MTPAQKLARSRLAIIEHLEGREHRRDARHEGQGPGDASEGYRSSRGGWLDAVTGAAGAWWRHHPAHLVLEIATPALQGYMRRKPFQVLGIAAGVGALLVVTKPWRLISLTTLVVAVVKSSQLSGVVMSALANAQGWQAQQEGREPEL